MARPRIDAVYQHKIADLTEQGLKPGSITRNLAELARLQDLADPPSERTVRRIYKEHRAKNPGQRGQYTGFRWPESMESAGIPWEASKSVLKLLRRHPEIFGIGDVWQPPVGFVRWFWRVEVAAPGLDLDRQARIAAFLFGQEQYPESVPDAKVRSLESFLIDEAWINRPEYLPPDVLLFGYPRWIVEEDDFSDLEKSSPA